MSKFQQEFRKVTQIMFRQLFDFSEIVSRLSRVTEMSHYPAKFTELVGKVTPGIPSQLDELATEKMFTFLDILKLQRQFLNDLLTLPEITEIPGAMDIIVGGHDTLDDIQSKVTELAFLEGGE